MIVNRRNPLAMLFRVLEHGRRLYRSRPAFIAPIRPPLLVPLQDAHRRYRPRPAFYVTHPAAFVAPPPRNALLHTPPFSLSHRLYMSGPPETLKANPRNPEPETLRKPEIQT